MKTNTSVISRFGLFNGLLPIQRQEIAKDVFAGITLAALGIPEVMGYTKISLTPVVTGLYTLVLPIIIFAILGSSRHLAVAADSATAAIMAGVLVRFAAAYSPEYVALAGLLALLCAGLLVVARVFRLGFLADFLSRSALTGFLTGVGIQVACGELPSLFGIPKHLHGTVGMITNTIRNIDQTQKSTAIVSGCVLLVIVGLGRIAPRFPAALLAVVGAIIASAVFKLEQFGVQTLGSVPSGLPHIGLPHVPWSMAPALMGTAASCVIVIIAQSAATSRSYALRYNDTFGENRDMIGLAAANVAAACSGTFMVNGSPTKTEMVDMAGGRSQLAQLTTAAVVMLVLLFATRPLSFMPAAVLSAVVFLIGLKLIDVKGLTDLYSKRREEFWIAILTALCVAFVGVEEGILLAVGISLIDHIRRSYRPPTHLLTLSQDGHPVFIDTASEQTALPGLMLYRFSAPLYYANSQFFMTEVLSLVRNAQTPLRWFALRFNTIPDVDYTAARTILALVDRLNEMGVSLVFTDVEPSMLALLERYGVAAAMGRDKIFPALRIALAEYDKLLPSRPVV